MRRRKFLAAAGGLGLIGAAGCVEEEDDLEEDMQTEKRPTVTNAPEPVKAVKPLAVAFHKRISEYYPDVRLFISPDEAIITIEIAPNATSAEELTQEFNRLALEFVATIKEGDFDPATLSVVASDVRAFIVESAVRAHVNGEINEEAFLKTIETMSATEETQTQTGTE